MTKFTSFHTYKIKFMFSGVNGMIKATCLQKIRDNNVNIKAYVLQDSNGVQLTFDSNQVKQAIYERGK